MLIAIANFGGAYAMYRHSKLAILFVAAIPVIQWVGFSIIDPNHVGTTDFVIDAEYLRQLPPLLKANLVLGVAVVLYTIMLMKKRRLM